MAHSVVHATRFEGGTKIVDVTINYETPEPQQGAPATRRKAVMQARRDANETAKHMAAAMRTGGKAAGVLPASHTVSHLELTGNFS